MSYVPNVSSLCQQTIKAALPITAGFRRPTKLEYKPDGSPVTSVDMQVHEQLLQWAEDLGLGYVGEEGNGRLDRDHILYVDPLDGTSSFYAGISTVAVAASIMKRVEGTRYTPSCSVIYEPLTGWWWRATKNGFTKCGKTGMRTTAATVKMAVQRQLVTSIFPPGPFRELHCIRDRIDGDYRSEMKHQSCGSLALTGGLIASGMTQGLLFGGGSAAEICAMLPIITHAGGVVSDLFGNSLDTFELAEYKGKPDFVLPNGAIAAASAELWRTLRTMVEEERATL